MPPDSDRVQGVTTPAGIADEWTRQKCSATHGAYGLLEGVRHPGAAERPITMTIVDAHFAKGGQPCPAFCRGDDDPHDHYCPTCDGLRAFCANCHSDHHEAGWETCKPGAYAEPDV